MRCPFCNYHDSLVKDSRVASDDSGVRRRRYCPSCNAKFSTMEQTILKELYVIKRSGVKKPFERRKIHDAIHTALRKRNTDDITIEKIVNKICLTLQTQKQTHNEKEIPTRKIGDMILSELAQIDEVAYIRFASVYKDFMTAQDFSKFIKMIRSKDQK